MPLKISYFKLKLVGKVNWSSSHWLWRVIWLNGRLWLVAVLDESYSPFDIKFMSVNKNTILLRRYLHYDYLLAILIFLISLCSFLLLSTVRKCLSSSIHLGCIIIVSRSEKNERYFTYAAPKFWGNIHAGNTLLHWYKCQLETEPWHIINIPKTIYWKNCSK